MNEALAQKRLIAKDPTTPPTVLESLLDVSDDEIDDEIEEAIAGNPNAPPSVFLRLAERFPAAFFANPSLDLLSLEDPHFFSQITNEVLCRHASAPVYFLMGSALSRDPKVKRAIAQNPSCPEGLLSVLASTTKKDYDIAVGNSWLMERDLEVLRLMRLSIVRHANVSSAILAQLSTSPDEAVRLAVSQHAKTPAEVLEPLSQDSSRQVRMAVAQHFATSSEVRERLKQDTDKEVSLAAKKYPESLRELFKEGQIQIRELGRKSFQEVRDQFGSPPFRFRGRCGCGDIDCEYWSADDYYDEMPELPEFLRTPPKRSRRNNRQTTLDIAALASLVEESLGALGASLQGLNQVASLFGEVSDWREACRVLLQKAPSLLEQKLCETLGRTLPLALLWEAISLRSFASILPADATGPAVSAFRHLVGGVEASRLGKYAWVLREPVLADVATLMQAQRLLLSCMSSIYQNDAALLHRASQKSSHPLARWVLVLLYNAQRGSHSIAREYGPLADWPSAALWSQAWSQALVIDPARVTSFFSVAYSLPTQREPALSLMYPVSV